LAKKEQELTSMRVVVPIPWHKNVPCTLVKGFSTGKPDVGEYETWVDAAQRACKVADGKGLDEVGIDFRTEVDTFSIYVHTPDTSKIEGRLAISPLVEVEKYLNKRGYETQFIGAGKYVVERPDSSGGESRKRGYFDVLGLLGLTRLRNEEINEELRSSFKERAKTSSLGRYVTLVTRGATMAKKTTEDKADKPTAKGTGGKDVELSPKKVEVIAAIKAGDKSGVPYGSGDERLPDPESIAASQLARDGVVFRTKVGARYHYGSTQAIVDKIAAAAEKAAAKAPVKAAAKKAAPKAAAKKVATGKAKTGPLKKPSEK
jgi:hypothetical protein